MDIKIPSTTVLTCLIVNKRTRIVMASVSMSFVFHDEFATLILNLKL